MNQNNLNLPYFFYLGGEDNEMVEIKKILKRKSIPFYQPQLKWGQIHIPQYHLTKTNSFIQVFVECYPEHSNSRNILIDHHGVFCHQPASLLQVLELLKIKPTMRQLIIASIDSDFLSTTINIYPDHAKLIWRIFQSGYRQNFNTTKEYLEYKKHVISLINKAEIVSSDLIVIYNAPPSMTLIAAFCDLRNLRCAITVGSINSESIKPCFYLGTPEQIQRLSKLGYTKSYWGKRYFGCRAIPSEFISFIKQKFI